MDIFLEKLQDQFDPFIAETTVEPTDEPDITG
jgi:hypothetical protein